jgi:hypothetical protein
MPEGVWAAGIAGDPATHTLWVKSGRPQNNA